ncbi:MAG: sigma-54-dependent transcriptional regulator [Planctomycetota bacterium]|jgi:two-component system response regulator HydG
MSAVKPSVLVIDDDAAHAESLGEALESFDYIPHVVHSGRAGLSALAAEDVDIVLTDLRMAEVDGMQVLEAARRKGDVDVVMVTGHGSVESAVAAMRAGAAHYITKPVNLGELREVLARIVERQRLRRRNVELEAQLDERYGFASIIGRSDPIQAVFRILRQVAPTDVTVLITGESGTGKELVARALHQNSRRRNAPFVALNCAALPESLLESELFGHEKGSFTGATARKIGHIENAEGGTLFLDEVGDMPLTTQVKILRVLEQREIVRVGSSATIPVDIRVVAATNQNLMEAVSQRRFREDLYFRLQVVSLELPPLRDRPSDVPLLVEAFVTELADRHGTQVRGVAPEVLRLLQAQPWPGNVRELRNVVENMVVTGTHEVLQLSDLPPSLRSEAVPPATSGDGFTLAGRTADEVEREHIRATLALVGDNRAKAARMMGIGERTLYRKIKAYGLGTRETTED